jgi:hypothetical protein
MAAVCPVCEAALVEVRSKLICPFCHLIVETCCDGGECRPAVKSAAVLRWQEFVAAYESARLARSPSCPNPPKSSS